ncbi:hypothetical protein LguiB_011082 [Lonicera macranthoides]
MLNQATARFLSRSINARGPFRPYSAEVAAGDPKHGPTHSPLCSHVHVHVHILNLNLRSLLSSPSISSFLAILNSPPKRWIWSSHQWADDSSLAPTKNCRAETRSPLASTDLAKAEAQIGVDIYSALSSALWLVQRKFPGKSTEKKDDIFCE